MAFNYSPKIINDSSLVLYLDAANPKSYVSGSTVWTDVSRGGNAGALTNGPTYNTSNGGSIVFDGTNQHINLGTSFSIPQNGTISFWTKLTNSIILGVYTGNQRPFGINGNFELRWGGLSGFDNAYLQADMGFSGPASINNGVTLQSTTANWYNTTWYNICVTYSTTNNQCKMYIQSVLEDTKGVTNPSGLTGNFYIGRSTGGGYLGGRVSNFMFYNRVLSESEVLQNYNALKGRYI
jgi:hypothetical protein